MNYFSFENQGSNTYLVYTVAADDQLDTMSLGMITNNKIAGLASALYTQMDAEQYIKYNVSAKISVSQFFAGAVNRKRLIGVFSGIADAILTAEDYMIDISSILLDLDYIFSDVSTCETVLICLPVANENEPVNLGNFFKNIMFSTQFDQTENCDYVAKIINYLNSAPVFSLYDFKGILDEIKNGGAVQPNPVAVQETQAVSQPAPMATVQQTPSPVQPPVYQSVQQPVVSPAAGQAVYASPTDVIGSYTPDPTGMTQPQPDPVGAFDFPGRKPVVLASSAAPAASVASKNGSADNGGKKMSMFYLLQHYSKENAEIYKAQKNGNAAAVSQPQAQTGSAKEQKKAKKEKKKSEPSGSAAGFAVPGVPGTGFAIPGQQPKPPAQPPVVNHPAPPVTPPVNNYTTVISTPPPQVPPAPAPEPSRIPTAPVIMQPPVISSATGSMHFGETTVLGGGGIGETTVLSGGMQPAQTANPHLIRSKNNEKISVDKPVFRIGKERSYVDYFIGDNPAISRSHANIIIRESKYYVTDTNSTNHTFVNGMMIQSNSEVEIAHGDKIRLANEDFEFRIY